MQNTDALGRIFRFDDVIWWLRLGHAPSRCQACTRSAPVRRWNAVRRCWRRPLHEQIPVWGKWESQCLISREMNFVILLQLIGFGQQCHSWHPHVRTSFSVSHSSVPEFDLSWPLNKRNPARRWSRWLRKENLKWIHFCNLTLWMTTPYAAVGTHRRAHPHNCITLFMLFALKTQIHTSNILRSRAWAFITLLIHENVSQRMNSSGFFALSFSPCEENEWNDFIVPGEYFANKRNAVGKSFFPKNPEKKINKLEKCSLKFCSGFFLSFAPFFGLAFWDRWNFLHCRFVILRKTPNRLDCKINQSGKGK